MEGKPTRVRIKLNWELSVELAEKLNGMLGA
jgi:hypothetical protein